MSKKLTTRYVVQWTPWDALSAAAVLAGWESDGGTMSVMDFVEPDDFVKHRTFPAFVLAVRFAREAIKNDFWNCPRIYRQKLDQAVGIDPRTAWGDDGVWEVFADEADPVETAPDWMVEAA